MGFRQRLRKIFRRKKEPSSSKTPAPMTKTLYRPTTAPSTSSSGLFHVNKFTFTKPNPFSTMNTTESPDIKVVTPGFEKSIEGAIFEIRSIGRGRNPYYPWIDPSPLSPSISSRFATGGKSVSSRARSTSSAHSSSGTVVHRPGLRARCAFADVDCDADIEEDTKSMLSVDSSAETVIHRPELKKYGLRSYSDVEDDTESTSSDSTFFCEGLLAPIPRPASSDSSSTYSLNSEPDSFFTAECEPLPTLYPTYHPCDHVEPFNPPTRLQELSNLLYALPRGGLDSALTILEILNQLVHPNTNHPTCWRLGTHVLTLATLTAQELRLLHRAKILLCLELRRNSGVITFQDHTLFLLQLSPDKGHIPLFSAQAFDMFVNKFYYDGVFSPAQRRDLTDLQPFYDEDSTLDPCQGLGVGDMGWLRMMSEGDFGALPNYEDVEGEKGWDVKFVRPLEGKFGRVLYVEDEMDGIYGKEDEEDMVRGMGVLRWDPEGVEEREWIREYVGRLGGTGKKTMKKGTCPLGKEAAAMLSRVSCWSCPGCMGGTEDGVASSRSCPQFRGSVVKRRHESGENEMF